MPSSLPFQRAIRPFIVLSLVLSAAGMCVLQALDPGVGPMEQPLSAHGLGAHGLLWSVSVALAGLAVLAEAAQWRRHASSRYGPLCLGLSGVSLLCVAVFTTDPWYPWQHVLSFTGWLHVIGTGGAMGGLWLAMLFSLVQAGRSPVAQDEASGAHTERFRPERSEGAALVLAATFLAVAYLLLLSGVLVATLVYIIRGHGVPYIGLEERVMLFLALGWLILRATSHPSSGAG